MPEILGLSTDELEERGGSWTAREIFQQPEAWREVGEIIDSRRKDIRSFLGGFGDREYRIVLTGAGTSAFAGEILAPALTRKLETRVDSVATTDIVSNPTECFAEDLPTLLVSFARSGNSPESVAATDLADDLLSECRHLIVTCDESGDLYRGHSAREDSLVLLMPEATNDQGFAMTSSFTSMTLAVWLALSGAEPTELSKRLAEIGEEIIAGFSDRVTALTETGCRRVVYIGSGPLRGLAHESSLKLLELTAGEVVTYYETPLGFRHGPKSAIDDGTLAFVYLSNDPYTRRYDLDLLDELRASMPEERVIAVCAGTEEESSSDWLVGDAGDLNDAEVAVLYVTLAQLVGLSFSLALGYSPDNPFPSGEVNRVVQGVTIHPTPSEG